MSIKSNFIICVVCFIFLIPIANAETNIYQYTQASMFSPAVKNALYRVYVPNSKSNTVSVIDPSTYKVIGNFYTGKEPQHVVPSYDLQTLWVLNNKSNSVTPIDPKTGKAGVNVLVDDPYNLYFTPDGKFAVVVCEARRELEFRDPKTLKFISILPMQCKGANHMDFTPDGHYAIVTCEYGGQLMKVDMLNQKVVGYLALGSKHKLLPKNKLTAENEVLPLSKTNVAFDINIKNGLVVINDPKTSHIPPSEMEIMDSMPQDVRSSADGKVFFVADMMKDGVVLIDPISFTQIGFIPTGIGTHAVYPSRDGKLFYISNRGCHHMNCPPHMPGSIAVIDQVKKAVIAHWAIPNGGSPDMGNISANGKELWLSGRYDSEVYVFDTTSGALTHRIPVGAGPHGLAYWPQPGRYSLGHTGNMR